jgi:uncharacterized protein (DUF2336 family)
MRRDLSTAVADALVEMGEKDVIRTLLANQEAKISRATMSYLVEQSRTVDEFQEPLVHRRDLPPDLARRMCLWVSAAIRQTLLERFEIDPDTLDSALEPIAQEEAARHDGDEPQSAATELAKSLRDSHQLTPALLLQTLRRGEIALFEALLASMAQLRLMLVRRFCYESGGQALAVVARGVGLNREEFATVYLLTRKARQSSSTTDPADLGRALEFYDRVDNATAELVLGRWRRDPGYLHAIRSVEEPKGRQSA